MCFGAHHAARAVSGVEAGDHACCAFSNDDEHRRAVARYAAEAFDRGERLAYVTDRSDEATVTALLDEAGLDAPDRLRSGQLLLVPAGDSYLDGGRFDAERQSALLASMATDARADGFTGLAVAAEMTWALSDPGLVDDLLAYEERVDAVFAGGALHAICLYDLRAFDAETVARARRAHQIAIETADEASTVARGPLVVAERDGGATLVLRGESDLFAAAYLTRRLDEAIAHASAVAIDAGDLRFADIATCRAIVRAAERLPEDRRLRIDGAPAGMRRVLSILGWLDHPRLELA